MDVKNLKARKSFGLILVLVLAILLGAFYSFWKGHQGKVTGKSGPGGLPPVVVTAQTIQVTDFPLQLEYVGQTIGVKPVEVRARVKGILLRRAYTEGQPVRQGQLLFLIDPATYKAALDRALGDQEQRKVALDRAKVELDRVKGLVAKGALSQKDLDDAAAGYATAGAALDSARAAVQEARINLDYTRVTAPISGITSKETRSEGNLVTTDVAGSLLTTVTQVDPLYVDFAIPADDAARNDRLKAEGKLRTVQGGIEVRMVLGDGSEYPVPGKVNFQDCQVDPSTGSIRARAIFPNPGGKILPGQFARVRLVGNYLYKAILVPQRAIMETQKGDFAYVLTSKDVALPRLVSVAMSQGNDLVIESGLTPGERVVVDGVVKVAPNATVMVVSADSGQNP